VGGTRTEEAVEAALEKARSHTWFLAFYLIGQWVQNGDLLSVKKKIKKKKKKKKKKKN